MRVRGTGMKVQSRAADFLHCLSLTPLTSQRRASSLASSVGTAVAGGVFTREGREKCTATAVCKAARGLPHTRWRPNITLLLVNHDGGGGWYNAQTHD